MLLVRGFERVIGGLSEMGFDAAWGIVSAADVGAPHLRQRVWILADNPLNGRREGRQGRPNPSCTRESEQSFPDANTDRGLRDRRADLEGGQAQERNAAFGIREDVANTSRIQSGRPQQRTERQRVRQGGESIDVADTQEQPIRTGLCPDEQVGIGRRRSGNGGCEVPDTDIDGLEKRLRKDRQPSTGEVQEGRGKIERGCWWQSEPAVGRVAHGVANRVDRLRAIGNGQVPLVAATAFRILGEQLISAIGEGVR